MEYNRFLQCDSGKIEIGKYAIFGADWVLPINFMADNSGDYLFNGYSFNIDTFVHTSGGSEIYDLLKTAIVLTLEDSKKYCAVGFRYKIRDYDAFLTLYAPYSDWFPKVKIGNEFFIAIPGTYILVPFIEFCKDNHKPNNYITYLPTIEWNTM